MTGDVAIPKGENGWPVYTRNKQPEDKEPETTCIREQPAIRQQQPPVVMNYPQPHQPIPTISPSIIQTAILAQRVHAPIPKKEWRGFQKTVTMLTPSNIKAWKPRRRH